MLCFGMLFFNLAWGHKKAKTHKVVSYNFELWWPRWTGQCDFTRGSEPPWPSTPPSVSFERALSQRHAHLISMTDPDRRMNYTFSEHKPHPKHILGRTVKYHFAQWQQSKHLSHSFFRPSCWIFLEVNMCGYPQKLFLQSDHIVGAWWFYCLRLNCLQI